MSTQEVLTQVQVTQADEAHQRFIELQQKLLDHYGVQARSRYVHLKEPRLRAHVLEAGQGQPVVIFHGGDGEAVNWAPLMAPLQQRLRLLPLTVPALV